MNKWLPKYSSAVGGAVCLMVLAAETASALAFPSVLLHQRDGAADDDRLGISVAGAGDVNGDGYEDFIVGAPLADPGGLSNAGSAYVYSGLNGLLLHQKDGPAANDQLGISVAGAGDVNGDGKDDFIIGAPFADPGGLSNAGSAHVYSGLDGGLLYQKDGAAAGDNLGYSVAGAGDVNGDGKDDFIIGAYLADLSLVSDAGSAYIYSGLDGGLLYTKNGAAFFENLGSSVAGAGDVNGDGKDDFIIGASGAAPDGRIDAGSAYVYSGLNGSLLYQKNGAVAGDLLGWSVAGAGDVNGDGKDDFIIGALYADPGGRTGAGSAYVYSGLNGGLLYQKDGAADYHGLGNSVAGTGDVNGDGYSDFIVGAPYADPGGRIAAGSAYVYSGLDGTLLHQKDGATDYDFLGSSVAGAGDVNGDGKDDLIVGAPYANPGGRIDAGSAYVIARGYLERIMRLVDVPNDQGRQIRIGWSSLPGGDNFVKQFAIYRRIDQLLAAGRSFDPFSLKSAPPGDWEFIQSVPAAGDTVYGAILPTLFDSTVSGGMVYSVFFVRALGDNPTEHFDSPVDSGFSLDNLAPAPPPSLLAAYAAGGNVDLDWRAVGDADFDYYRVYRDTLPAFGLSILKRVGSTSDTAFLDTSVPSATVLYYKVTAVDFSGNEGGPSNEAVASACACNCHADPQCDGITDIFDVTELVTVAFRNGAPILDPNVLCPRQTTDVDCSGATDILDVTRMVNVAFRNGDPATEFCNPCP